MLIIHRNLNHRLKSAYPARPENRQKSGIFSYARKFSGLSVMSCRPLCLFEMTTARSDQLDRVPRTGGGLQAFLQPALFVCAGASIEETAKICYNKAGEPVRREGPEG